MNVFIANFGMKNSLWESCRSSGTIATFDDEDTWPLWRANNREAYIAQCVASKKTAAGITPTRSVASRWFNIGCTIEATEGDVWIHREKGELWWAISQPGDLEVSLEPTPSPGMTTDRVYIMRKRIDTWSNRNRRGGRLEWAGLHPRAQEFLFTEGTVQKLSDDHAKYALDLIDGSDLGWWHSRDKWRAKEAKARRGAATSLNARERAVARMAMTVHETVAGSNQQVVRTTKPKENRFDNPQKLEAYIQALLKSQEGLCAVTGIPLQFDGETDDSELLCSLDRISSDDHYEPGNLQIVCRFVNRWKNDDVDANFRRLIDLVRNTAGFD